MTSTIKREGEFKSRKGEIILVAGEATSVSMGIIHTFLKEEATVVAPIVSLRDRDAIKAYKNNRYYGNLVTMLTDIPDFHKATALCEAIIEKYGKLDIAVGLRNEVKCHKLLSEALLDEWDSMIDNGITSFFVQARVVLNVMKQSKTGLFVSVGDGIEKYKKSSALSKVELTTIEEMSKIFAEEATKENIKYYHIKLRGLENIHLLLGPEVEGIYGEQIGAHILELYDKETYNKEAVFEIFPAARYQPN